MAKVISITSPHPTDPESVIVELVCHHESHDGQGGHRVAYKVPCAERYQTGKLYVLHSWGLRDNELPICPAHRDARDQNWHPHPGAFLEGRITLP